MDARTLDAIRISDGAAVMLKIVDERRHPNEANTALFLSSKKLTRDPRNHSVPVIEVFSVPNQENLSITVLPLLRPCNDPDLGTVGEATEFLRQIFEVRIPYYVYVLMCRDTDGYLSGIRIYA
jgi:hypothetical protein